MEMIEHEVIVDEYIEVKLKIPKRLDAMELKAITTKANKLFNLSEVSIEQPKVKTLSNTNTNRNYIPWSDKDVETLVELAKTHSMPEIAEKMNIDYQRVRSKLKDMGIKAQKKYNSAIKVKVAKKRRKGITRSVEEKKEIMKKFYSNKDTEYRRKVAKSYGFSHINQLHKAIWDWKNTQNIRV